MKWLTWWNLPVMYKLFKNKIHRAWRYPIFFRRNRKWTKSNSLWDNNSAILSWNRTNSIINQFNQLKVKNGSKWQVPNRYKLRDVRAHKSAALYSLVWSSNGFFRKIPIISSKSPSFANVIPKVPTTVWNRNGS